MNIKGGADKEQYGGASSNVFCCSLTVQSSLTSWQAIYVRSLPAVHNLMQCYKLLFPGSKFANTRCSGHLP